MGAQKRRQWRAEQKLQILEEARQSDATVSEVCRRHGIGSGQFYKWERLAREGALDGLRAQKRGRKESATVTLLEDEVQRLRAVIAELSAENLELKKGRWP
jgi:transposase-like protein